MSTSRRRSAKPTLALSSRLLLLVLVASIMASGALADYGQYTTFGNDRGHQRFIQGGGGDNYTIVTPPQNARGSPTEPIVGTFGTTHSYVVMQQDNETLNLYDGRDPSSIINSAGIGLLTSTGALCDLNGDGTQDYVSVAKEFNTSYFFVMDVVNNAFVPITSVDVNDTDITGNVICSNFFSTEGDTRQHAFFLSKTKQLYDITMSGNTLTPHIILVPNAVSHQAAQAAQHNLGSGSLVQDDTFDNNGKKTLLFWAGNYTHYYTSDGDSDSIDLTSTYSMVSPTIDSFHLMSGIHAGLPTTTAIAWVDGDWQAGSGKYTQLRQTKLFGIRSIGISGQYSLSLDAATLTKLPTGTTSDYLASTVCVFIGGGQCSLHVIILSASNMSNVAPDSTYIIQYNIYRRIPAYVDLDGHGKKLWVPIGDGSLFGIDIPIGGNLTPNLDKTLFNGFPSVSTASNVVSTTFADLNGDGAQDIIYMTSGNVLASPPEFTSGLGSTSFAISTVLTTATPQSSHITAVFNHSESLTSTQRVSYDVDSPDGNQWYATVCSINPVVTWNERHGFGYNFTGQNVSIANAIAGVITNPESALTAQGLNYAFNATDNFLDWNKQANVPVPGTTQLQVTRTMNGDGSMDVIAYDENNNIASYLSFLKTGTSVTTYEVTNALAYVNHSTINTGQNRSVFTITYDQRYDTTTASYYYTPVISIDNISITTPFKINGSNNRNSIKNIELFFTGTSGNVLLSSVSFGTSSNIFPSYVVFKNLIVVTDPDTGNLVVQPSEAERITGDGFTVLPAQFAPALVASLSRVNADFIGNILSLQSWLDRLNIIVGASQLFVINAFTSITGTAGQLNEATDILTANYGGNGVFFSQCTYPATGTYTQRHYFTTSAAPTAYSQYRDLTVTVTEGVTNTTATNAAAANPAAVCTGGTDCHGGVCTGSDCTFTGDSFTDTIYSWLALLGITSAAGRFFLWMLISMLVGLGFGALAASWLGHQGGANMLAGGATFLIAFICMFVIGVLIGMIPLWVLILLVLFGALLFAAFWKNIIGG